jgi:hypothetical protein
MFFFGFGLASAAGVEVCKDEGPAVRRLSLRRRGFCRALARDHKGQDNQSDPHISTPSSDPHSLEPWAGYRHDGLADERRSFGKLGAWQCRARRPAARQEPRPPGAAKMKDAELSPSSLA